MIKRILLFVGGLIVLLLLIGFVLPRKFELTKSEVINAPAAYVFEEINTLDNWPRWSYWNTLDPDMEVVYSEQKSGTGAYYEWTSEVLDKGKLVITDSKLNKLVACDLFFMQSEKPSRAVYQLEPAEGGTKLTMNFDTDFGMNPIMRWVGLLMFPSEMNKAFDHNFSKLKEIAAAKPKFTVTLSEETTNPISYIGISSTMSFEDIDAISAQMGKSYGELMGVLQKAKVEMTGAPFCLYPRWDEEKKEMDMVCALPVPPDAKLPAKYPVMQIPGGKAVKAIHLGDYHNLEDTHNQVNQYIEYKNLQIIGAPWEVYITDPEMETDTTKWITEVFYPVKE
ncbi:MAG: SRPBCC family protein [Cyclobacteriaceae bacterium]|nr:SRPBCC family protein [Cyclobacteriaceae bacterium]